MKTPRPYLSWSQMNTLQCSEKEYIKIYFKNKPFKGNIYTTLGSRLAKRLEFKKQSKNKTLEIVAEKILTKADKAKSEVHINIKLDDVPLFSILDFYDEKNNIIREVKTGLLWDQTKVDNHGQLLFYALTVYLKYNKIPEVYLDWAETRLVKFRNGGKNVLLTGRVEAFKAENINLKTILVFSSKVRKVWKKIQELSITEQQNT